MVKVSLQAYQEQLLELSAINLLVVAMAVMAAEMKEVMRCLRPISKRMTPRVSSRTISVYPN